jgi:hypothetical protein
VADRRGDSFHAHGAGAGRRRLLLAQFYRARAGEPDGLGGEKLLVIRHVV